MAPECQLMAVVKADGYGHGAVPVARAAAAAGASCFGVATLGEGLELRQAGVQEPVLVLGNLIQPEELRNCLEAQLMPTISTMREALLCQPGSIPTWPMPMPPLTRTQKTTRTTTSAACNCSAMKACWRKCKTRGWRWAAATWPIRPAPCAAPASTSTWCGWAWPSMATAPPPTWATASPCARPCGSGPGSACCAKCRRGWG